MEGAYKTQTTAGLEEESAAGVAVPLTISDILEDWIGEEIWRP